MKKEFSEPKMEIVDRTDVHMAKSWNKGKGRDTTDKGGKGGRGGKGGKGGK